MIKSSNHIREISIIKNIRFYILNKYQPSNDNVINLVYFTIVGLPQSNDNKDFGGVVSWT